MAAFHLDQWTKVEIHSVHNLSKVRLSTLHIWAHSKITQEDSISKEVQINEAVPDLADNHKIKMTP